MNNNILIIPDVHGRNYFWNKLHSVKNDYDSIIFLGDYMDSFTISSKDCFENLKKIVEFKLNNFDKTTLLWGNHDVYYAFHHQYNFNWLNKSFKQHTLPFFKEFYKLFSMYWFRAKDNYYAKNILMTHAGIINKFNYPFGRFNEIEMEVIIEYFEDCNKVFAEVIESKFDYKGLFNSLMGHNDSFLWARYSAINVNLPDNILQIVGHTPTDLIKSFSFPENNSEIIFTDVMHTEYQTMISLKLNQKDDINNYEIKVLGQ